VYQIRYLNLRHFCARCTWYFPQTVHPPNTGLTGEGEKQLQMLFLPVGEGICICAFDINNLNLNRFQICSVPICIRSHLHLILFK
jgi:hypothetical protein